MIHLVPQCPSNPHMLGHMAGDCDVSVATSVMGDDGEL